MKIYESGENYLETIYVLQKEHGTVRSIDVARELNFSKPSISRAMSILKSAGYVSVEKGGNLVLSETGLKIAEEMYERHQLIAKFFVDALGVPEEVALKDSCRIEHVISAESFGKIKEWLNKR